MKASDSPTALRRSGDGPATRWVGFRVGQQHYALDILRVQEVLASADIEPVPGAPPAVLGVINLRGRIITAIDLRLCLGFAGGPVQPPCCVIVVDVQGETLGLRVDGVAENCSVAEDARARARSAGARSGQPRRPHADAAQRRAPGLGGSSRLMLCADSTLQKSVLMLD
jgi:purine-binding chemotaxis protein CheW